MKIMSSPSVQFDPPIGATAPTYYKTEIDEASSSVTYAGQANPGSLKSAASWQIRKVSGATAPYEVLYADGNANFDNIWDNRAALAYS